MSAYPEIVRNAVISPTLTLLAYIKPGVYHRYSPDRELMDIIGVGSAIYDVIVEAVERGVKVSRGDIPASGVGLGKLICEAFKKAFTWIGKLNLVGLELVSTYPLFASAISYLKHKGKLSESSIPTVLNMLLTASTKGDALEFYNTVKLMSIASYTTILDRYGISRGKIEIESYNLYDLFNILSEDRPVYHTIVNYSTLASTIREIILAYDKAHDLNYAIVRGFLYILRSLGHRMGLSTEEYKIIDGVLSKYTMYSKEFLKVLYDLDRKFRRYSKLMNLLPVLSNATFVALTLRLRP